MPVVAGRRYLALCQLSLVIRTTVPMSKVQKIKFGLRAVTDDVLRSVAIISVICEIVECCIIDRLFSEPVWFKDKEGCSRSCLG
jgi:hypothetical protein